MNDQTSTIEAGTAIALPAPTQLADILTSQQQTDELLARLIADGDAEFAGLSAETKKGRDALIALASKASKTRAEIARQAKALTEDWRTKTAAVNAGRKVFEDGLAAARDRWRGPVTKWEVAEEARVDGHKVRLAAFDPGKADANSSAEQVRSVLDVIEAMTTGEAWDEFQPIAVAKKATALTHYRTLLAAAEQRERDAAELARLRAEAEERALRDAEESARKADAERQAQAKAERERLMAKEAEDRRIAAEQAEARRIEAENAESARREQAERDKAESADRARQQAEADAARREKESAERHARELAEAKAREESAAQRERDRLAAARKAEADARTKREADQAHRARIRDEIAAGLKTLEAGNWFALADALIDGKVPHCEVRL